MDNSVKVTKEWLVNHAARFTHNDTPIDESTVFSLADEFTSTLTQTGKEEVGKRITEFEIFHADYGWIKCHAAIKN